MASVLFVLFGETFGEAGYPVPEKRYTVNSLSQNQGHGVIPNSPELG